MDLISRYRDAKIVEIYDGHHQQHAPLGKVGEIYFTNETPPLLPRVRQLGRVRKFLIKLVAIRSVLFAGKGKLEEIRRRADHHRTWNLTSEMCGHMQWKFVDQDKSHKKKNSFEKLFGDLSELEGVMSRNKNHDVKSKSGLEDSLAALGNHDRANVRKGLTLLLEESAHRFDRLSPDQAAIMKKILSGVRMESEKWPDSLQ